jgi:hypothetical protein
VLFGGLFRLHYNTHKIEMILSILICSHRFRKNILDGLLAIVNPQLKPELLGQVEILLDLSDEDTGKKRNGLIKDAAGEYVWFINDGDFVSETAVQDILKAAESKADFLAISGLVTINGKNPLDFHMSITHKNNAPMITGDKMILLKTPSYIAPIKKSIVEQIPFGNSASKWSRQLNESGLLKTQEPIEKPIYHLRHIA